MRRRDENFPANGFEDWGGYMNAKVAKLEEQFSVRAGKDEILSNIFNGICIYVNGFTIPSADELKILMSKHAGIYHTYQRNGDFIIAANLPDTKVKNMNLARVVKPEWITESIAANRLLDYKKFLLYRHSRSQKQLNFQRTKTAVSSVELNSNLWHKEKFENDGNIGRDESNLLETNTGVKLSTPGINIEKNIHNIKPTDLQSETNIKQNYSTLTKTAADPNFITEFYNNSRLHHISQLGACFKQLINDLRENSNFLFPARVKLKEKALELNSFGDFTQLKFEKNKIIMHIDMDCFFVSVGLRNRPDLKGKPIAVTHSKGGQVRSKRPDVDRVAEFNLYKQQQVRKLGKAIGETTDDIIFESRVDNIGDEGDKYGSMSEIASCSYEARSKGISNGMFMGSALRFCPDLQTIPYDFDGYKDVAYILYNTIAQYTLDIEAVSCDEMYVDCTELISDINVSVQNFATVLRDEIKTKTSCPCSTGFGGNRLQARLATKKAKPDGQFFLTEDLIEDFIFDIKLSDLPGVGRQTAQKLESLGHNNCGSLQTQTLAALKNNFGNKTGTQLFEQCRGRDPNPLTFNTVRKSVSAEVNYGIRFDNNNQCVEFLKQLSAEVHTRMDQLKVAGKCITLKLMVRAEDAPVETAKYMGHGFCKTINKSITLNNATHDIEVIAKEVISLCQKLKIDHKEMRGIGIQVTKLEPLNSKSNVGAINKYLSSKKVPNKELKNECSINIATETSNSNLADKPRTPTKSSKVKSPTTTIKSPTSKKRGRPPKSLKPKQSSKTVMNKFLQVQNISKDTPYKYPMSKGHEEETQSIVKQANQSEITVPRGLLALPWDQVRDLLRAWLDSAQPPLQCDVNMIVEYLQEMIINKNIEKLYVLMNFLKRRTREIEIIAWSEVYEYIVEQVQNAMTAVYGKKLFITN